ncbi:chloride channel protein [Archaeoglobus sp.]
MRLYLRARYLYLMSLSVIVGAFVGVMSFVLHVCIEFNTKIFLHGLDSYMPPLSSGEIEVLHFHVHLGILPTFLIPAIGGLICGVVASLLASETLGGGTKEAITAFHTTGKIRARVPFVKTIVTGFTIGSGGSGGREGPIMQIGAGIGSIVGGIFKKISEKDRRILLACGMSAGMGSIFLSPIGGAIFGVEVLYKRDYEVEALVPAVVSSITAYAVFHSLLSVFTGVPFGTLRIFNAPDIRIKSPIELIFYALLGIVGGFVSLLYIKCYKFIKKLFRKLKAPTPIKPAIGGFIVGLMGWKYHIILGTGYGYVQMVLDGLMDSKTLWIATFAKILATTLTVGSGGSGGLFAPGVVIGAMLGGGFGELIRSLVPTAGDPRGYVLAGMVTLLAGAFKTPLSAVIMVFEMTGSYNLLPALAIASTISYIITGDRSICDQPNTRVESPVHIRELSIDVLRSIKVKDAMIPAEIVYTVTPDMTLLDVLRLIEKKGHIGFPVLENGKLVGIITFEDVEKVPIERRAEAKVRDVMSTNLIVTYPDETLEDALIKLATYDIGRLPVVSREDKTKFLGLITRSLIVKAHAKAIKELFEGCL